jgi:hypothetical protein
MAGGGEVQRSRVRLRREGHFHRTAGHAATARWVRSVRFGRVWFRGEVTARVMRAIWHVRHHVRRARWRWTLAGWERVGDDRLVRAGTSEGRNRAAHEASQQGQPERNPSGDKRAEDLEPRTHTWRVYTRLPRDETKCGSGSSECNACRIAAIRGAGEEPVVARVARQLAPQMERRMPKKTR